MSQTHSQAAAPVSAAAQGIQQYLTFALGGEVFAIGILAVKEIIEYSSVTAVPMMPAYVRGVINLRGSVVPVVDLAVRFGRMASEVTRKTCIVIIEVSANSERQDIGVVVDAVHAVVDIAGGDIEPPPAFGCNIRTDFMQGMGKVDGRFVILLDVDHILALDEVTLLARAADPQL